MSKVEVAQLSNSRPGVARRHWKLYAVLHYHRLKGARGQGRSQPEQLRSASLGLLLSQLLRLPNFRKPAQIGFLWGLQHVADILQGPWTASAPTAVLKGQQGEFKDKLGL